MVALGLDIGGTKCAVLLGKLERGRCVILQKERIATRDYPTWQLLLADLIDRARRLLAAEKIEKTALCGVGISCGGPLDLKNGLICSPPNLPGWDKVPIVSLLEKAFGVPVVLCNDADACAVAEWRFGAGQGCRNLIFLTFGTGMGAGLILNGALYTGGGFAGEVGHMRLAPQGPVGYGKAGSFEGFCSGGGLVKSAVYYADACRKQGMPSALYDRLSEVSAQTIAEAAAKGDAFALYIMKNCAKKLGQGLAVLIDILNPEKIIIGSIYERNQAFFDREMLPALQEEALPAAFRQCEIVPAALGEAIGDVAALSLVFTKEII